MGGFAPGASAAETAKATHILEFKNGESLRGVLLASEPGGWRFRSESVGELTVAVERASVRTLDPEAAGTVARVPAVERVPARESAPVAAAKAPSSPWKRMLEAGYSLQAARVNRSDAYFRTELLRERSANTYRFFGKYIYGQQGGVRSADRFEGGLAVIHDFADRVLLRQNLTYQNDRLRQLDADALAITGVGYKFLRGKVLTFTAGPGVGVRYREVVAARRGFTFSGDFTTETVWNPSPRIRLTHKASVLSEIGRLDEFRLLSTAVATGKLTESVNVNLRYEYEFDHGRSIFTGRIDQRVFTTLGYVF
jgi:putative salt-induced outer membrane protein YdiY